MLRKEEPNKKAKTRKIRRVRIEFNIPDEDFQKIRKNRARARHRTGLQDTLSYIQFTWSWVTPKKNTLYVSFHDTQGVNNIKVLTKPRVEFERKISEVQPGAPTPTVRANTPFIPHRIDVESNWVGKHVFR